jgi:hypothetical protein
MSEKIWGGVCRWFLGVLAEEKKPLAPIAIAPQPHVEVDGPCPMCGEPKGMQEIYQASLRCFQCGFQPRVVNPPGLSRAQLATFEPDAEHQRKFNAAFAQALARVRGLRR